MGALLDVGKTRLLNVMVAGIGVLMAAWRGIGSDRPLLGPGWTAIGMIGTTLKVGSAIPDGVVGVGAMRLGKLGRSVGKTEAAVERLEEATKPGRVKASS